MSAVRDQDAVSQVEAGLACRRRDAFAVLDAAHALVNPTVRGVRPRVCATSVFDSPAAQAKTSRARARACAAFERAAQGAEVAAIVAKDCFGYLDAPIERVAAPDVPVPFSPTLEDFFIPSQDRILDSASVMVGTR